VNADPEFFTPLDEIFGDVSFNFCAQDEHVPEIERYVRTVKDRARSAYNSLPFAYIPRLMVIRLISNAVFWLNAFPRPNGVANTLSPRHLLTGKHLDYRKHVQLEFSSYVQMHETHTNDMRPRTIGAICRGPSGNEQGGHYFMSLATGRRLICNRWTELPMPQDAIDRVGQMGRRQQMPKTLTFADRFGFEFPDAKDDVDDDHDSDYEPEDDDASDDESTLSLNPSTDSSDDDSSDTADEDDDDNDDDDSDDDDDDDNDDDNIVQPLPGLSAGVNTDGNDGSKDDDDHDDVDNDDDDDGDDDNGDDVQPMPKPEAINIWDETIISNTTPDENTPTTSQTCDYVNEAREITGVEAAAENAGVDVEVETVDEDEDEIEDDEQDKLQQEMDERYGQRQHSINLRDRKPRSYDHLNDGNIFDYDHVLLSFEDPLGELFLTEQMSLKKGLKYFGKAGAEAVVKEMRQLDYLDVMDPVTLCC
jgi:hypothetical protein